MRALIALAWTMLCAVGVTAAVPRAQVLWAQGDFRSAFAEAFEPALQGDREAQFLLGEAYRLGRSVDANPALAHIYGYESPEALIAFLRDISRQLYVDANRRDEFVQIMKTRGSVTGFESQVYRKTGEVIWISENARAVIGEATPVE